MTPDTAEINLQPQPETRSTAGMTTKVVKGSLWTLAGQVAPLGVSLFTTPFVIRLLGSDGYGVLILVGLIPTYFAFADFGMGIASTKFASEAYAAGDSEKEARTVRTAALIALIVSLPVAAAIFIFSNAAISAFNVPPALHTEANLALKLASITFVIGFLNNIFNTPQLTRLRMDLNTFVNSGFRMLGLIATPVVIYLGGGILGAVAILLIVALLTLAAHLYVSGKLLNQLFQFTFDKTLIRPMLKFGGALAVAGIAGLILANIEKGILPWLASVKELAFYSIAFTLASMLTMFSSSMSQSLLPAFSQLHQLDEQERINQLLSQAIKINLIWLVPAILGLSIIAKPFLTIWAGSEFGENSVIPFYILLLGLAFHILTYLPYTMIMAAGRTNLLAKIYFLELLPYTIGTCFMVYNLGALGAAIAWSFRIIADSIIMFIVAKRVLNISLAPKVIVAMVMSGWIVLAQIPIKLFFGNSPVVASVAAVLFAGIFIYFVWVFMIDQDEMTWIRDKVRGWMFRASL